MKKIKYLSVAFVVIAACTAVIFAKAKTNYVYIHNQTNYNVGTAHIGLTDFSYVNYDVTGSGNFGGPTSSPGAVVGINGYAIYQGTVGIAIDANNDTLKVDFTDPVVIQLGNPTAIHY